MQPEDVEKMVKYYEERAANKLPLFSETSPADCLRAYRILGTVPSKMRDRSSG